MHGVVQEEMATLIPLRVMKRKDVSGANMIIRATGQRDATGERSDLPCQAHICTTCSTVHSLHTFSVVGEFGQC